MSVAVFIETAGGTVRSASLPAITAARELATHRGGPVVGIVLGADVAKEAADAARYVDRVLVADAPDLKAPLAETYAPVLVEALRKAGADAVVATASSTGKDVLPRAAALWGGSMVSDIVAVLGKAQFRRPTYAGNALAEVELAGDALVISVRQTDFTAAEPAGAPGTVEALPVGPVNALGASFVALHESKSERPDLAEASVVVSGGRGMKSADNFKLLGELADLLGGALGASRAAADAGLVPNDLQVGQTGKVVAPKLYIAVAISGAIQHLAGMKGSKTIVAINKDGEAPIFQVADYGLVGNWETIVPALMAEIKKVRGS